MKKVSNKKGNGGSVAQELRNLGVLVEDNTHKLGVVAEQVGSLTEKVSTLTENLGLLTEKMTDLTETVEIVKTDVGFIKSGLKKKVDYDEFMALEKRVRLVESKVRR